MSEGQLRLRIDQCNIELIECRIELEAGVREITRLERRVSDVEDERNSATQVLVETQEEFDEDFGLASGLIEEQEEEIRKKRDEIHTQGVIIDDLENEIEDLENEIKRKKEEIIKKQEELDIEDVIIRDLDRDVEKRDEEIKRLNKLNDNTFNRIRDLENERLLLEDEVDRLMAGGEVKLLQDKLETLRENIDKITVKIGEQEQKLRNPQVEALMKNRIERAKIGKKRIKEIDEWIATPDNTETILKNIDDGKNLTIGHFLKNMTDGNNMTQGFIDFFNGEHLDSKQNVGDAGELALRNYLRQYIKTTLKDTHSNERIISMYNIDRDKKIRIALLPSAKGVIDILPFHNFYLEEHEIIDEKLKNKAGKIEAQRLFDKLHKDIMDSKDIDKMLFNILTPQSKNAYEDVNWYFGKGEDGNENNELIFDTKMLKGTKKISTGDIVGIEVIREQNARIIFYGSFNYKTKEGSLFITKAKFTSNLEWSWENHLLYNNQFREKSKKRDKMINRKKTLAAANVGAFKELRDKIIVKEFGRFEKAVTLLKDVVIPRQRQLPSKDEEESKESEMDDAVDRGLLSREEAGKTEKGKKKKKKSKSKRKKSR